MSGPFDLIARIARPRSIFVIWLAVLYAWIDPHCFLRPLLLRPLDDYKAIAANMSAALKTHQQPLKTLDSLPKEVLDAKYDKISDPSKHWQGYSGPCYTRKAGV